MVKVSNMQIPPEWEPLLAKIVRWFDNQMYPVWCSSWFRSKRSNTARSKANSILDQVAAAWDSIPDKSGWEAAAAVFGGTAYNLFTKDQSYRIKNGLPGVATPSPLHQYTTRKVEVTNNVGENNECIYRRRHISNLPAQVSLSIKTDRSSGAGQVAVTILIVNKVRGNQWPTFYRLATIEGDQDWTQYAGSVHRYITDRVSDIGIVIGFEKGWEGTIWLDNTRIIDHGIDRYVGWRQNKGTDDWRTITNDSIIKQTIVYGEL